MSNGAGVHPQGVRSAIRAVLVTFAASAALALVAVVVVSVVTGSFAVTVAVFGVQATFLVVSMAASISSMGFMLTLRDVASGDRQRERRFARAVFRQRDVLVDDQERWGAVQYAAAVPAVLGFQVTFLTCLYIGLFGNWVGPLALWTSWPGRAGLVAMIMLLVAVDALLVVRIRRARRYVTNHRELLLAPFPSAVE